MKGSPSNDAMRPRTGGLIPPSRCGCSAPHRARTVAITESVRSPMILLRSPAGAGSGAERPLPEGGIIPPLLAHAAIRGLSFWTEINHASQKRGAATSSPPPLAGKCSFPRSRISPPSVLWRDPAFRPQCGPMPHVIAAVESMRPPMPLLSGRGPRGHRLRPAGVRLRARRWGSSHRARMPQ